MPGWWPSPHLARGPDGGMDRADRSPAMWSMLTRRWVPGHTDAGTLGVERRITPETRLQSCPLETRLGQARKETAFSGRRLAERWENQTFFVCCCWILRQTGRWEREKARMEGLVGKPPRDYKSNECVSVFFPFSILPLFLSFISWCLKNIRKKWEAVL